MIREKVWSASIPKAENILIIKPFDNKVRMEHNTHTHVNNENVCLIFVV